jgi:hypothetical protein
MAVVKISQPHQTEVSRTKCMKVTRQATERTLLSWKRGNPRLHRQLKRQVTGGLWRALRQL